MDAPVSPPERSIRIEVTRTSGAVPASFETSQPARVLDSYRRAVNLLLGDRLVTLADASLGGLPNGLQVQNFDAVRASLADGTCRDIELDFRRASVWSPKLEPVRLPADLGARRRALERAALRLPSIGLLPLLRPEAGDPGAGVGVGEASAAEAVVRAARRPFEALRHGLRSRDADAVAAAGSALIGLGLGLTPSGDDLLVGFTAALTAAADPMAAVLASRWAEDAERGTGRVALNFHRHAAAREYSERIHDLLSAILVEPIEGIDAAVRRAAGWGATSGGDTVVGVVSGLAGTRT